MAVKIGTVFLALRASAKEFQKDIKKAMHSTARTLNAAAKDIAKIVAVTMTAAFAALSVAIRKGMKDIDDLAKASGRLGLTTEALQGMRRAAMLTGVEVRTLQMAVQRMVRRVAEAAQGTGEARDAIRELGLEAKELVKLSPDQQFQRISRAMEGVALQADKIRLAQKLFDSEGVAMVQTLALGEEGLRAVTRELEEYGLAISRIDAIKVESANDALARAGTIVSGIGQRLAVEVAPVLEIVVNRVLAWSKANDAVNTSIEFMKGSLGKVFELVLDSVHIIKTDLQILSIAWLEVGRMTIDSVNSIIVALGTVPAAIKMLFNDVVKYIGGAMITLADTVVAGVQKMAPFLDKLASLFGKDITTEFKIGVAALRVELEQWNKELVKNSEKSTQAFADSGREGGSIFLEALSAQIGQGVDNVKFEVAKSVLSGLPGKRAREEARREYEKMLQEKERFIKESRELSEMGAEAIVQDAEMMKEQQREIAESAQRRSQEAWDAWRVGFNSMSREIDRFVDQGKFSFKSLIDSFINDMIRMQLKKSFEGLIYGIFPGLGGAAAGVGRAFSGIGGGIRSIFGFADGGRPPMGQPFMVGERGPEIMTLDTPSTVTPNGAGIGGVSVNQTFNFEGGVTAEGVEDRLREFAPQIMDATIKAVADLNQRGGGFRTAITS